MHPPKPERGRFGIRARLLTLLLPGVLALLALDSWNDYRALRALVQDAYDQSMLEPVSALSNSIGLAADGSIRVNTPFSVQAMFEATRPQYKHLYVGLTPLPDGQSDSNRSASEVTLLGESDLPRPPVPPDNNGQSVWYDAVYRGYPVRVVAVHRTALDGHARPFRILIQAAEGAGPRLQAQADSLRQELLRDARMVLVMILLVWLGVSWSLRPLERLRKSVLQSKGSDLKPLDTSDVPHEVAPLVDAVNQYIASYRDLLDQQSQFLADASHQLRTPLAIMLTQAGFALREKDPEQLHETLRAIVTQISRSRRLCEQLLSLAHASEKTLTADAPDLVDLNAVARDVVLQYLTLAHEKNQDLGWTDAREERPAEDVKDDAPSPSGLAAAPVVPVLARGPELHEALANLVHNAIVYTPSGGRITVMASIRDGMALAEVHDSGPGIDKARRAAVFERFHHGGSSPGKGPHGAGLGLAIARAYARRNGGDIELADLAAPDAGAASSTSGLRAILRLPLAPGHQG
ncbi:two-component system, OmpR family, sensor histidine kinase TctE [Polaromonas sp. OV174]|uniref:sensor histidine kinase n=1 Tax=Polaromonas sp. OV174 TaxID=1855300 RepID=UPI0008EA7B7E|nr:sensor histidine kinase [Polaromonas sp. OV174]SFC12116.1 two-component system, OmpR family, sensor histidine kinase TctE [Polaromonas sp. OV174]